MKKIEQEKDNISHILSKWLQFKYMVDDIDSWIKFETDKDLYVPTHYALFVVKYQYKYLYYSEIYEDIIDISIVIYNGGVPMGIWPLSLYCKKGKWGIGSYVGGGELLPPFLLENRYNTESIRKMLGRCARAVEAICVEYGILQYTFQCTVMDNGNSSWFRKMLEEGAICKGVNSECFTNLYLTEEGILSRIRRTNKYSILKGLDNWRTVIISNNNTEEEVSKCFESFRMLHKQVSGRETRNVKTWEVQEEAVNKTNDFVVMLYDREDDLVGASLFSTTASACTYSVAAYRRDLFDKPLGHVCQWVAIKYMKELGIRWYYIGVRSYKNDWNEPTEKEVSIGHFKEGFATNIYNTLHVDVEIKF